MNKFIKTTLTTYLVFSFFISFSFASINNIPDTFWDKLSVHVFCGLNDIFNITNSCQNKTQAVVKNIYSNNFSVSTNTTPVTSSSTKPLNWNYIPVSNSINLVGPQGPAGPKGDKGDQGESGLTATSSWTNYVPVLGPAGPAGANGVNGTNGTNGKDGSYITLITQGPTSTLYYIYNPSTNSTSTINVDNGQSVSTTTINNLLSSSLNTLSSDVNGSVSTTSIINSVTASSSGNLLQTIVNGISSVATTIINLFTQNITGNTLTTNINGLVATSSVISSNNLSLSTTTLNLNINGVGSSVDLASLTANTWSMTGNLGTSTSTNFLGTIDSQDLIFKTNNTSRFKLTANGSIMSLPDYINTIGNISSTSNFPDFVFANFLSMANYNTFHLLPSLSLGNGGEVVLGQLSAGNLTMSGAGATFIGIQGSANTLATTTLSGNGSSFMGWNSSGNVIASSNGSIVQGLISSTGGGTMESKGNGTFVRGRAQNGAMGRAAGPGSMVSGFFSDSGSLMDVSVNANGAHALGGVEHGGQMLSYGAGSFTTGYVDAGTIRAGALVGTTHGSIAMGFAASGGSIINEVDGSLAGGYGAPGFNVYNNGVGSIVWGTGVSNTGASYSQVFGYNIANTTSRTFSVGWDNIQLKVNDAGIQVGNASTSGIVAQFTNSTGYCTINPTTTSLSCTSDINLKKNITKISDGSEFTLSTVNLVNSTTLDKISYLDAVAYNWKSEADTINKHTGFIAQQVEQAFPDLVTTDPKTNIKSVNYNGFVPYIIDAIKELKNKTNTVQYFNTIYSSPPEQTLSNGTSSLFIDINNYIDTLNNIQNEPERDVIQTIEDRANQGLSTITDFVVGKITAIRGYFGELFATKVQTKELCVDDVCVTRTQFLQILNQANVTPNTNPVPDNSTSTPPDTSTSTDPILPDNSTTTNP